MKNIELDLQVNKINRMIQQSLPEEQHELVSDWYHTFKELYAHRVALFIALCNTMMFHWNDVEVTHVWKSKLHSDWTMFDGWFIAGIGTRKWETLTYHLPMEEWGNLKSYEIEKAPEWDGHTSDDVLRLLRKV